MPESLRQNSTNNSKESKAQSLQVGPWILRARLCLIFTHPVCFSSVVCFTQRSAKPRTVCGYHFFTNSERLHKSFLNQQGRNGPRFTQPEIQLESLQDSGFQNKTEKLKTCFSPRSECNYLLSIISQQQKAQLENCGKNSAKFPLK